MALPGRTVEVWLAALSGSSLIFAPFAAGDRLAFAGIGLLFLTFALLFLFRIRNIADAASEVAYTILAFIYIPFLLMHLVMLRQTQFGVQWLLVIMLIVMTNDTAAYYTGCTFGRNKLYPLVSPKKSIEGALVGWSAAFAAPCSQSSLFFSSLHSSMLS